MKGKKKAHSTITGIIIPAEWGENDEVTAVSIQTTDDEEYLVDPNKKGKELLDFIDWQVEATGIVKEEDGNAIFKVSSYSLMDEDEEWDDT
jgi:hypothetical protein